MDFLRLGKELFTAVHRPAFMWSFFHQKNMVTFSLVHIQSGALTLLSGGSYSFGLRVCPIKNDMASFSARSSASHLGYEIWRKWEDCLAFQESLEIEYSRMAREKRNRLAAGKGIKKNGVYFHGDQAASFESLPPGPDPHSVAQDIHNHVPKLTKKGTIFRASQATVNQRHSEFQAMINALFDEDVPTLIKELKTTHTFTDFFGFWRRDHDLARKLGKELTPTKSRSTITGSPLSEYFFASSPSLLDILPSPPRQGLQHQSTRRLSFVSDSSSSASSVTTPASRRSPPRRTVPPGGSSPSKSTSTLGGSPTSSFLPSTPPRQASSASHQPTVALHDIPVRFGHVPEALISDRPTSMLESLPEDRELPGAIGKMGGHSSRPRRRAGSIASEVNRGARVYGSHSSFHPLSEFGEQEPNYLCKWTAFSRLVIRNVAESLQLPPHDNQGTHGRRRHPRAPQLTSRNWVSTILYQHLTQKAVTSRGPPCAA